MSFRLLCAWLARWIEYLVGRRPVTQALFEKQLARLWSYALDQTEQITILGEAMAVTQADLDALAEAITRDVAAIKAEIAALQEENPHLNLDGLRAAVASLDAISSPPAPEDDNGQDAG